MRASAALQQRGQQAEFECTASTEAAPLKDESDQRGRCAGVIAAGFCAAQRLLDSGSELLFRKMFGKRNLVRRYCRMRAPAVVQPQALVGL
ncbi:MAG: hypothetical protein BGO08_04405 [Altererythrobacter sp. 66-12]|nr:MAG: hypothetical protein BGO08_04405 [Altererythrobacter sp. 66-12]